MSKDAIAHLVKDGRRYELNFPEYALTIRGPYIEWVLEAAADIIASFERTKAESAVEELRMLQEFGDGSSRQVDIDTALYEQDVRFETVPQCVISMNEMDYRWVAKEGRKGDEISPMQRLHDISLTRNGTFLHNQAQ
ncbi:MAG: hypothetical protein ACRCTI_02550 [Beijerinckiaceae bacterium]